PTIGYALPAFRYLFPRSGLRGEARKAALAVAAEFAADSRTDEEKARDGPTGSDLIATVNCHSRFFLS
ncbi:MAG: hypothetical protein IJG84_23220, partial [Kiritimatiellae bacterium]|nr:hypothetical protein [Kiritimatiellia bacterium]